MSMWTLLACIGTVIYLFLIAALAFMIYRLARNPDLRYKPSYEKLADYFENEHTLRIMANKLAKEAFIWISCIALLFILGWYRFLGV